MTRRESRVTWLFHTISALSLVLLILFSVWWVRSYWVSDLLTWSTVKPWHDGFNERDQTSLFSVPGSLCLSRHKAAGSISNEPGFHWSRLPASIWADSHKRAPVPLSFWNKIGFGYHLRTGHEPTVRQVRDTSKHPLAYTWNDSVIGIPFWLPCLLSAIIPLMWVRRRVANRSRGGEGSAV